MRLERVVKLMLEEEGKWDEISAIIREIMERKERDKKEKIKRM